MPGTLPPVTFYTQVLLELVAAVGGALALGNGVALLRRRRDRFAAQTPAAAPAEAAPAEAARLAQAPVLRSVVFLVIGVVACVWSLATLVAG